MQTVRSIYLTRSMVARVIADILLINLATFAAVVLRFLYLVEFQTIPAEVGYRQVLLNYLMAYLNSTWLLTAICIVIFALSGFYTFGRSYRGRYKAWVIARSVSLGFLLFGFLTNFIPGVIYLPRGVLVLAWVFSLGLLIAARLGVLVGKKMVETERQLLERTEPRKVQTVLVIGGAGYIGSALLPKLLDAGYRVRLLDRLVYGIEPIKDVLGHPMLEHVQADFRQVDRVVEAMRGVDAVIHLGAIVGDPACAVNEELTTEVNLMATRMIAEVAKGSGIDRLIFASTCSVYGASDEMLDEHSALRPVSLYARSKIASERVLLEMADNQFTPVILRFATIYGLSGRTRFDLVINLLTAKAMVDGQITVFGGDQWRPFVHVDDAALAIFKALQAPLPAVRNQIFNVGSSEQNYTIQQIGELIHAQVPSAQLINVSSSTDRRNYRVNFNKIYHALGFVPAWTVEQGIRQVIEAIRSGRVKDYQDAKYNNYKFLTEESSALPISHLNDWAYALLQDAIAGDDATVTPTAPSNIDNEQLNGKNHSDRHYMR